MPPYPSAPPAVVLLCAHYLGRSSLVERRPDGSRCWLARSSEAGVWSDISSTSWHRLVLLPALHATASLSSETHSDVHVSPLILRTINRLASDTLVRGSIDVHSRYVRRSIRHRPHSAAWLDLNKTPLAHGG